jgi:hypothetical protein
MLKKQRNVQIDELRTPSPEVVKLLTVAGISPFNREFSHLYAEDYAKGS